MLGVITARQNLVNSADEYYVNEMLVAVYWNKSAAISRLFEGEAASLPRCRLTLDSVWRTI
jgi:hypothetical protein